MTFLSIVVPAFDEAENLCEAVETTAATLEGRALDYEIVVVDDGSVDATPSVLEGLRARWGERLRVETHPRNLGLGAALRTGIGASRGEFCMIVPADSPLTPEVLRPFLEVAERSDLVLGFRPEKPGYSALMRFNSKLYHALLRLLFRVPHRDVNWQHLYRRSVFERIDLSCRGVVMLAEVVVKARRLGLRIAEVPCPMPPRRRGKASAARPRVMARTLFELARFFVEWRLGRAARAQGLLAPQARPVART